MQTSPSSTTRHRTSATTTQSAASSGDVGTSPPFSPETAIGDDVEDVRREIQIMHHLTGRANISLSGHQFQSLRILHPWIKRCDEVNASLCIVDLDFVVLYLLLDWEVFTEVVGSPPEVLCKHYGTEADVWTAGVILHILLSGVPPFWAETQQGIFDAVLKEVIDFESGPWPLISDSAKDLIEKMLCSSPDRLTAHQVIPGSEHGVAPDRALDPGVLSS